MADAPAAIEAVQAHFRPGARCSTTPTACRLEFADWRFNVRSSNTEPLVRLNVESRGDAELVKRRVDEISAILNGGA